MKAKEKAEELILKYRYYLDIELNNSGNIELAKLYSLIAVDEILNEYPYQCPKYSYEMERHLFWQEVRIEIEKM
jgi:hypothetical protein